MLKALKAKRGDQVSAKRKRVKSPKNANSEDCDILDELKSSIESSVESSVDRAINRVIAKLWDKLDGKLSSFQTRIEQLEGDVFDRDQKIEQLEIKVKTLTLQTEENDNRSEELERHSRSANLVLTCERFGRRREGEDIGAMAVDVINDSFQTAKGIVKCDFSAVHRLGAENTVICAFVCRNLRNELYEGRFSLSSEPDRRRRLYLSESLTKAKNAVFKRLLEMRREDRIWAAFTKNGIPAFKLTKESSPTRVLTQQQLDDVLRRAPPPGSAGRAAGRAAGRPAGRGPDRTADPARQLASGEGAPPAPPTTGPLSQSSRPRGPPAGTRDEATMPADVSEPASAAVQDHQPEQTAPAASPGTLPDGAAPSDFAEGMRT